MNQSIPILDLSILIKKLGAETYLIRGQESWEVNEVAEIVCLHSNGKNTIEDIVEKVSAEFQEDKEIIEKDIKELIDYFLAQKIMAYS